ncbi:MAG: NAD(P)/FAD-dependent oxidoreductase [Thermodesulfobacteriota bacterium]|nr:NAD(P)/FAD-dependent oxidoreductase [Thermodesulfobacteriota bacterium]
MADLSFDAVLVGGGSKGLVAAMYLAHYGGMSVGIFEDRVELGGGWCSEESPAPGFNANHCSHVHGPDLYHAPVYEDFPNWEEYGAKYAMWPVSVGAVFEEDDSWIGIFNKDIDPSQERTAKLISRFSERDAETWLEFWERAQKYYIPAVKEFCFNPALPFGQPDAMDRLMANPDAGLDPTWLFMSPFQMYQDLFESPEAQVIFNRGIQAAGFTCEQYGNGLGAFLMLIGCAMGLGVAVGGNHHVAHACHRVILENGGKVFTRKTVKKIIIENGRAKGIKLEDGTEIEAKKLVLSGVDPHQLCVDLVGAEHLSSRIIRKIKNIERSWITITWYTWALHERPRYKAESFESGVEGTSMLHFATKNTQDLLDEAYWRRLRKMPPNLNPFASDTTQVSPESAPPGKATVLTEQWVIPAWAMKESEWKEYERKHADELLKVWQKHAPNMTWDNVIGYVPITPFWTAKQAKNWGPAGNWAVIDECPSQTGRLRPILELASGRMPIKDLYATGAGWHPWAGGSSIQGYNIYKIISEDFGLRKPWEEKGRPY